MGWSMELIDLEFSFSLSSFGEQWTGPLFEESGKRPIMAYLKQLHEDLKKHFINEGAAGSNPGKGSKHWVCKYCETRFDGTASVLKNHFLNRCSLDRVRRPLSVEERARREEGIRMGKFIAETIHAGGRSRPATNSLASVSSLVADAEQGRTESPAGTGEAVVGDQPAAIPPTSGESVQPAPRSRRPLRQTVMEDADSIVTRNEQTSRFLDRFLFCTNQPFSIVDNEYFLEFVDAVKKAHPSWMPYKRDEARTKRLDGHYGRTKVDVHAMVKKWHRTGCMLQMDGWSDRRNRPYINVMVSSPIGMVFWKTTCMEGKEKDVAAYFRILDGVIKEIGEEAVVGVVMDNARVCVKGGKMVEAAYPRIFRVGCTAHALNLALEDMYKELEWLRNVVDTGLKVGKFFHNVDKARALFHVYSPKSKLKRPGVTRFATNHKMLASLKKAKNPLKNCVDDAAWVEKMVRTDQLGAFHEVTAIVLGKDDFWATVDKALAVIGPVVTLLRLVDAPGPSMSKVYFKMDSLVARMRELDCITAGEKAEIEDILMRRWAFMTSELHCAAAFLDPEHRHTNVLRDPEVCARFNIWLLSWAPDDQQTRDELSHQVDMWVNLDGSFKSQDAAEAARVQPVALWWEAYREVGPAPATSNMEVGEEDGSEPLMWTWQRNDAADNEECDKEDMALLGSLEREWHECTKPGRRESTNRQKRVTKRARAAGEAGGDEAEVCAPQPKKKRGRPSLAEAATKKAELAAARAAKAAEKAADKAQKKKKKVASVDVIEDDLSGDDESSSSSSEDTNEGDSGEESDEHSLLEGGAEGEDMEESKAGSEKSNGEESEDEGAKV
ncbi:hypothetical protein CBR_g41116 [Chara braunii]|uniref:DUF659 domain-containing protein n=1 Tax=Chara braunii TaxID=69332 RepID=A0A388LVC4_CHABU|nr:hypothetical protein CBR_g41116 [Chara braunii]|eukprot:GBG86211.1 hypothetical protein CBR_g41116 [Chara braunii]